MLKIIGETHPGRVRSMNQDVFSYQTIGDNCGFAIVCDGMGGARAGDVASKTTCDILTSYFSRDLRPDLSDGAIKAIMFSAISAANAKVYSMAKENWEYAGMGTTLVAAVVMNNDLHIISIGDSRLYVVDNKKAVQLTHDHTVTQHMVDIGELTAEQALTHERRHQLTRAVGVGDTLDIDYQMVELQDDYRILMCSDGLSNYTGDEMIAKLVKKSVHNHTTKYLVDYANNRGGSDNITAVVMYRA